MECCTLYCKVKPGELSGFADRVSILANDLAIDTISQSVTCRTQEWSAKFTMQAFTERGDSFSRLVGKTYIYFEGRSETAGRDKVLAHLDQTESVIGIVADPSFETIHMLESLVFFLATEFDALIFDGESMRDGSGEAVS